jgi:hypothetical protein
MHMFTKIGFGTLALGVSLAAFGCSGATDDEGQDHVDTTAQALGQRCTVRGGVTTGCGTGETCAVVACTNSIPPTCWGTCQSKAPPPAKGGCEGAFNCLCGTPACVNGEWTCIGNCGPGGATE